MVDSLQSDANRNGSRLKIYGITMARNDADIVLPFLAQADELFDQMLIVDVKSTDGTLEVLKERSASGRKIQLYSIDRQEKYQSAIVNRLARLAVSEGADWVFFLDVDEFINVGSRSEFEDRLRAFPSGVMHMPWINLVPTRFGTYTTFDPTQSFYWSGRTSRYNKIAVSRTFIASNPQFHVFEGNHDVTRDFSSGVPEPVREGFTLLHLPIRSADRFKYKMLGAKRTLMTKHSRKPGEGSHVLELSDLIDGTHSLGPRELSAIAATYGDPSANADIDPVEDSWPMIELTSFTSVASGSFNGMATLDDTIAKDNTLNWIKSDFPKGSQVGAEVNVDKIEIRPQPLKGNGELVFGNFPALPPRDANDVVPLGPKLLIDVLTAAFMKIEFIGFSAWSELVPTLFSLFAINRPRRFVELGTHNGMCFFGACQASKAMELGTQCVAVDNWIGDAHASFHSEEIFDGFMGNIQTLHPEQFYVRANFDQALICFDEGSVDLLHIDGYHTYEAVKNDFDTWLPKMSAEGVIIFHDINVHERGFGVWRFWDELKVKFPSFSLFHCHGLGIVCTGQARTALLNAFEALKANPDYKNVARHFLQLMGHISIEYKKTSSSVEQSTADRETFRVRADQLVHENREIHAISEGRDVEIKRMNEIYHELLTSSGAREAECAGTIHELRSSVLELQKHLSEHEARIAEQEARVAERDARLADSEAHIADLRARQSGLLSTIQFGREALAAGLPAKASGAKRRTNDIDEDIALINGSNLFDRDYYLAAYVDVAEAKMDPVWHYVVYGAKEGRNPSLKFDTVRYMIETPDAVFHETNPLAAFIRSTRIAKV